MDDNMSQLKNKKIRIKHLNENDKKIGTNLTPNNNKISKFLSRKKGMFQITCVSMDNMRKMSNNNMYSEDSTDDTDDIQHVEENNINDTTHTSTNQIQPDDSQSRDDYSQLFFTTNSLGCTPIIATSPQYGLAIKINDLVLNGQRLSDYHLHIDDNGVKIIGNDLKDLETSDLNQSIKVVKIESTEQFKRGRWTCMDYIEHSAIQNSNAVADKDDNDGKQYVSTDTDDNELARKKSAELPKKSIKKSMFTKNPGRVHHDVTFADKDGKKIRFRKPSLKTRKVSEHQNNRNSHVSEMRGADKIYALSSNDFIKKNKNKTKCNALYTLSTDLILQKIDNFEDKLFKKIFAVEEDQSQPNYSTNNIVYEIKHLEIKNNNTSSFDNDSSISEHLQNATEIQTVPMNQLNSDEIPNEVKNDQIGKADNNELTQMQQQMNNKNSSEIISHEEKAGVPMSATAMDIPNNNNNEMNTVKNQVEMVEPIDKEVEKIKNDVAENPSGNEENKRSEEGAKKIEMEEYQQNEPQQQQQQQQQAVGPDPVASSSRQVNEVKEESSNEEGENSSEASGADIDNKIGQAMDLVKSHLMFAVREEVEILKEKITELMDRINQLEVENSLLKANASPETLHKLSEAVPQREEQQKHLLEQRQQKQHQLQQLLLQQQLQQQQLLLLLQPSQKNKQPKFKPPQDYQKQLLENQKKLKDMQLHLNNPKHDDKNDQNQMDGKN